jgi:hypothetical protein
MTSESGDPDSLGQGRVGLGGRVHGLRTAHAVVRPTRIAAVQRRQQGDQARRRRRILQRPAATAGEGELSAETERGGHAIQQHLLDLGARRRGRPEHALGSQPSGCDVTQQRHQRCMRWEVSEESGMLPVQRGGNDHVVQQGDEFVPQFGRRVLG